MELTDAQRRVYDTFAGFIRQIWLPQSVRPDGKEVSASCPIIPGFELLFLTIDSTGRCWCVYENDKGVVQFVPC